MEGGEQIPLAPNLEKETLENTDYRRVIKTTANQQLVLMSLLPHEDIPEEMHAVTDQFIRVEAGEGLVSIAGVFVRIMDGSRISIPHGVLHYVLNTSETETLKLYTIYSPPQHPFGTIHRTRDDAERSETFHITTRIVL